MIILSTPPYLDLSRPREIARRVISAECLRSAFLSLDDKPEIGRSTHGEFGRYDQWEQKSYKNRISDWLQNSSEVENIINKIASFTNINENSVTDILNYMKYQFTYK